MSFDKDVSDLDMVMIMDGLPDDPTDGLIVEACAQHIILSNPNISPEKYRYVERKMHSAYILEQIGKLPKSDLAKTPLMVPV